MPNIETLLREHVTLNVDCIDRLYLNGYVPLLQRPQNLWYFLHEHLGYPVVSPTVLKKITDSFVDRIRAFAERHRIPVVHFDGKTTARRRWRASTSPASEARKAS